MKTIAYLALLTLVLTPACSSRRAVEMSASDIDREVTRTLSELYETTPAAKTLGAKANGILVFPTIAKGGFVFAGKVGNGALRKGGATAGYYNISGVSYGFQAGIEKFSYVMFFMTDSGLSYLEESAGFEIGAGPSLTVVDEGFASNLGTSTLRDDIYAFSFAGTGLMGGVGLKGSKITKFNPNP